MGSVATQLWSQTRSCATLCARHRDCQASWTLELSGEADIATLDLLRQELAQMAAMEAPGVVVDVTALAFCDGASAELILAARRTSRVTVVGATGSVKRLFDLLDGLQKQQQLGRFDTPGEPLERAPVAV